MTQPQVQPGSGIPAPVAGVTGGQGLPQGVASIEGSTGNVIIAPPSNVIQFRKGDIPQSLQVYEYFHSNTDYSRLSLNSRTGGPFQVAVETAPPAVVRNLEINTSGVLTINAASIVTPTTIQTLEVITTTIAPLGGNTLNIGGPAVTPSIIFTIGATQPWMFTSTFQFTPTANDVYDIGTLGARVRTLFTRTVDIELLGAGNGGAATLGAARGTAFGPISGVMSGWLQLQNNGVAVYVPYWQ